MANTEKLGRLLKRVSHAIESCTTLSPLSSPIRAAKRQRIIQDFSLQTDQCLSQLEFDLDLEPHEVEASEQEDRRQLERTQEELEHHQDEYLQARLQLQHPHMRPANPPVDPMTNKSYSHLANYALNHNNRPTLQISLFKYITEVPTSSTRKPALLDTALKKLIMGYDMEPAADWDTLVLPYIEVFNNWKGQCKAFLENDNKPDLEERILTREKHIQTMPIANRAIAFVNYVVRTIETLKFTLEWETKDQTWKSAYLTVLFNQGHGKDPDSAKVKNARKQFVVQHCKLMSARSNLLMLYHAFGVNVLLDPFWDIAIKPSTPNPASLQLLTLLAAHPPSRAIRREEEEEQIDKVVCNVASMQPSYVTLVGLLDALSGSDDVADYLEAFINKFPPTFMTL